MLSGIVVSVPNSALFREGSDENCPAFACGDPGRAAGGTCRPGADPRCPKDRPRAGRPERVSQDQADRDAILALLARTEVRQIAARAGLSLEKAQAAVSTLQGQDLKDLASQARQVNNDLVGGNSNIVISTTTIIIVLLIVILIVLIAD